MLPSRVTKIRTSATFSLLLFTKRLKMSYKSWFEEHAKKHKIIVEKLQEKNYTKEQIINYFDFENMVKSEKDFCPLYQDNKKCHDMLSLNCYACACPNFRFNDEGFETRVVEGEEKTVYSFCDIDSKDGRVGVYGAKIHQDCSKCQVPHHKSYVEKHFSYDWLEMMQKCEVN